MLKSSFDTRTAELLNGTVLKLFSAILLFNINVCLKDKMYVYVVLLSFKRLFVQNELIFGRSRAPERVLPAIFFCHIK